MASKYHGAVVPLVTPLGGRRRAGRSRRWTGWWTAQIAGGVEGIFVLGTTGEGAHVPREMRRGWSTVAVRRAAEAHAGFAGLGRRAAGGRVRGE